VREARSDSKLRAIAFSGLIIRPIAPKSDLRLRRFDVRCVFDTPERSCKFVCGCAAGGYASIGFSELAAQPQQKGLRARKGSAFSHIKAAKPPNSASTFSHCHTISITHSCWPKIEETNRLLSCYKRFAFSGRPKSKRASGYDSSELQS
jgi:hypothetical protein